MSYKPRGNELVTQILMYKNEETTQFYYNFFKAICCQDHRVDVGISVISILSAMIGLTADQLVTLVREYDEALKLEGKCFGASFHDTPFDPIEGPTEGSTVQ